MKRSLAPARKTPLPQRSHPVARTSSRNTRISLTVVSGAVEAGRMDPDGPERSKSHHGAVKAKKRAHRKRALRFGGVPENPSYVALIRTFPCILKELHECSGRIEAAHTGPRGRGQKAVDESCLPMCARAHRTGKDSHHAGSRVFWSKWGIDRKTLVLWFNRFAKEAGIHVAEGAVV